MDIKPIETVYNGYRFRSRLEARWAVFFDTLGIKYGYEVQDYLVGDTRYLPDFLLSQQNCFIEIKGQPPTRAELDKCALLALVTDKPVYLFHGNIWVPGVDDTYTTYYDDEKKYLRGVVEKGAYYFDPECISLTIDDTASACYNIKCIHDEQKVRCPSHDEMYYPGTNEDQYYGTIHATSAQAHLMRIIYIADIENSPGDSCKLRLDARGQLQYLIPTYQMDPSDHGKKSRYLGRKPVRLPDIIQEHKRGLEQLLRKKPNTWEWGIGSVMHTIYSEDVSRWRECPFCGSYWITRSSDLKSFPCYSRHEMDCEHPIFVQSDEEIDRTPNLIEAYTAARQARFEYGERGR